MLVVAPVLGLFLYLDQQGAAAMLGRWKPQAVAGNLVSVTGVERYARARIELEREGTGALVHLSPQDTLDLFVVHTAANETTIEAVVWHAAYHQRIDRFHRLRQWHARHFPNLTLRAGAFPDDTDLVQWVVSEYDA
jgi:hypothetical protein